MNPEQDVPRIDIPPLRETAAADAVKRAGLLGRLGSIALGLAVGAMLAGGGFFYGLDIGRRTAPPAEPPLVRAQPGPIKEQPEDPGGIEVPFQDRLVFDGVRDATAEPDEVALAGAAEEPLTVIPGAVEDGAAAARPEDSGVTIVEPNQSATAPPPPPPLPEEEVAAPAAAPPAAEAGPIVVAGTDIAAAGAAGAQSAKPPAAGAATAGPPIQLTAAPPPFRIQVGAYRSDTAALAGWKLVAAAHRKLLEGLKPTIVKIDLGPGRGVFHRLQAGPLADRPAAAALCKALRARDQGCLVIEP